MRHFLVAGAAIATLTCTGSALAELNDPPYFQLLNTADTASSVSMCGTSDCTKAEFTVFNGQPAGTGYIDPFLRFQHNEPAGEAPKTYEAAYNTDARPLQRTTGTSKFTNQAKDENHWNHSIMLGDLVDNGGFYEFYLDINEPGGGKETITIDELQFFLGHSPDMNFYVADERVDTNTNGYDAPDDAGDPALYKDASKSEKAAKVWDLDWEYAAGDACAAGNPVVGSVAGQEGCGGLVIKSFNEPNGGNGSGDWDLVVRLPTTLFSVSGYGASDYVYLYNFLGSADSKGYLYEAESGFEEWAALVRSEPDTSVPEPATSSLLFASIIGAVAGRRRWRRRAN